MALSSPDPAACAAISRYLADARRHETEALVASRGGRPLRSHDTAWWARILRRAARAEENDPAPK